MTSKSPAPRPQKVPPIAISLLREKQAAADELAEKAAADAAQATAEQTAATALAAPQGPQEDKQPTPTPTPREDPAEMPRPSPRGERAGDDKNIVAEGPALVQPPAKRAATLVSNDGRQVGTVPCWCCEIPMFVGDLFCHNCYRSRQRVPTDERAVELVNAASARRHAHVWRIVARGERSKDAIWRRQATQHCKRARQLGYASCHDRFENDRTYAERILEHNGSPQVLDDYELLFLEGGTHTASPLYAPASERVREERGWLYASEYRGEMSRDPYTPASQRKHARSYHSQDHLIGQTGWYYTEMPAELREHDTPSTYRQRERGQGSRLQEVMQEYRERPRGWSEEEWRSWRRSWDQHRGETFGRESGRGFHSRDWR